MIEQPRICPNESDVREAANRLGGIVHRTPVARCASIDERARATVFMKCEHLQKVGAFKFRGASNAILSLSRRPANGVATHSSGNHAAALALAARMQGMPATVVMPEDSARVKLAAVRGYGANVVLCAPTIAAREATLQEVVSSGDYEVIHPYEHADVIAGQGTAALELLQDVPELDLVLAPLGGGGLLSGTTLAVAAHNQARGSHVRVFGVEPTIANDGQRGLALGQRLPPMPPVSIADGLRTDVGETAFALLRKHEVAVLDVSEDAILEATRFAWERAKLFIEPSSAVVLAALFASPFAGKRVGVILSGGNVDLDSLRF